MKISKNIIIAILAVLLVVMLFYPRGSYKDVVNTTYDTITTYQTIKDTSVFDSITPIPIEIYDTTFITIIDSLNLDTPTIVKDWLTRRIYRNDTLINDSNIVIVSNDTIQYNRKKGTKLSYSIYSKEKTVTITNNITAKYSIGGYLVSDGGVAVNGTYQIHGYEYGVMYDLVKKRIGVGVKIRF